MGVAALARTMHAELDLAELQAVIAYRDAVRALDELEQQELGGATAVQRGLHARKVTGARVAYVNARAALEAMFLGDA